MRPSSVSVVLLSGDDVDPPVQPLSRREATPGVEEARRGGEVEREGRQEPRQEAEEGRRA